MSTYVKDNDSKVYKVNEDNVVSREELVDAVNKATELLNHANDELAKFDSLTVEAPVPEPTPEPPVAEEVQPEVQETVPEAVQEQAPVSETPVADTPVAPTESPATADVPNIVIQ
jgi:hypothetical protein